MCISRAPSVDLGAAPVDVGEPVDAGDPIDVGSPEDVAEVPPDDTGSEPVDVGAPPLDAGAPRDVVTPPRDAGSTARPDVGPQPTEPPPARAYSRGMCPRLVSGPTAATSVNTGFRSESQTREFRVIVPRSYDGTRPYPVVFASHWLNASSGSFIRDAELETAAEETGFIAVLPDALRTNGNCAYLLSWPFAAIESLSGGLGEQAVVFRMEYTPQANKFPALVLWGGPSDWLGLSFQDASIRYRDELSRDGHFVVQCTHAAGHAIPPIPAPAGGGTRFRFLWQFMMDHTYGMAPGTSPWLTAGLPTTAPSWCSIVRR